MSYRTKEENRGYRRLWISKNPEKYLFQAIKSRAKKFKIPFTICLEDVVIPERCPVLGILLVLPQRGKAKQRYKDDSPSLDRLDSFLGYVPGNVCVISLRANRLKNNGTAEEHRLIADWMEMRRGKEMDSKSDRASWSAAGNFRG